MKIDTPVQLNAYGDVVDANGQTVADLTDAFRSTQDEIVKRINLHPCLVRALGRVCNSALAGDEAAMRAAVDDAGVVLALAIQP